MSRFHLCICAAKEHEQKNRGELVSSKDREKNKNDVSSSSICVDLVVSLVGFSCFFILSPLFVQFFSSVASTVFGCFSFFFST